MTESMDSSNSNEYGAFIGRVDWFDSRKGYGFVVDMTGGVCLDGSNNGVFVHFSDIVVSDTDRMYRKLHPGEYVSFDEGDREGKTVCLNVRGVNGGPLLTENTGYNYKVFRNHTDNHNENYSDVQGEDEVVEDEVVDEVVEDEVADEVVDDQDPESEQ